MLFLIELLIFSNKGPAEVCSCREVSLEEEFEDVEANAPNTRRVDLPTTDLLASTNSCSFRAIAASAGGTKSRDFQGIKSNAGLCGTEVGVKEKKMRLERKTR